MELEYLRNTGSRGPDATSCIDIHIPVMLVAEFEYPVYRLLV
jgi:hypothetical protein